MKTIYRINEKLTTAFERLTSSHLPLALAIAYAAIWAVLLDII